MAHGWNSYFHNISPLSSDPRTLRRTSESEGSHSQHIETITGHYDFPGTAASCEATATNSNFNTDYYSNSSIGDSRSDCVYQRYYNETPWPADGEQMEKQSSQGCGNADTDFATDGSSFFSGDLQGLKQDHGMLAKSFLEDFSDVSSCSDPDICETRPSCKFMACNSVQKPKPCVSIKHKSSEWLYTETKNMTFPSGSSCSKMGHNKVILSRPSNVKAVQNIVNYAQDKMESPENTDKSCAVEGQYATDEMSQKSDSKSVENINDYDGCEKQKQKENIDRDLVQGEHSNVEVKRKYPHDQKKQIIASALNNVTLFDDRQQNFDKLSRKEMKGSLNQEEKLFDNPCSPDDQDRNLKEAKNYKSEASRGKTQKSVPSEKEDISNPTSTNVQEENMGEDVQHKSEALKGEKKEFAPYEYENFDNDDISNPTSTDEKNRDVSRNEQNKSEALNGDMKDSGLFENDNPYMERSPNPNSNIQDETVSKDEQVKNDLPKEVVKQSGLWENENFDNVSISNPTSTDVRDLNISKEELDKSDVLKGEIKKTGSIEIDHSNGQKSPDSTFSDGLDENKEMQCQYEKTHSITSQSPSLPDIKMSVCKDVSLELGENLTNLESNTHFIESCLQRSKHQSYKNVAEENIGQSPAVMSNGLFSDASDKTKGGIETQPESSSELNSFVRDIQPCQKEEWTSAAKKTSTTHCPDRNGPTVTGDNFSIDPSALKQEGIASHEKSCLLPYSAGKDINPLIDKEITRPPEMNAITISSMECGDHVLTSDNEGERTCGRSELCLQSNTPCMDINPTLEKEGPKSARNVVSNFSQDQQQSPHQSPVALEQSGFNGGVAQNATESFEGLDTEELMHVVSHDEPLLREDSSYDTDETKLDNQYKDSPFAILDNNMDDSGQEPKLESSIQLRIHLHPVVMLNTLETVNGMTNSYCCAVCQHKTKNADELIGHHRRCHSVYNFQFCKTCNLYPINDDQAEKHVCGVTKASPQLHHSERKKRSKLPDCHTCIKCRLKFLKFYHYIKHMRSHTGKTPFQCNDCGLYFSQSSTLRRHKLKPGRCKRSNLLSVSNSDAVTSGSGTSLQVDMLQSQSAKLPECYVKLVDIRGLHLCQFCGKTFLTARMAKKHYNVHNGTIQEHLQSQPNTKPSAEKIRKVSNETSGIYKCPFCPRIFKYTYNRSRHLRDCVREKIFGGKEKLGDKYLCPLCQATFTTTSSRYRHIKTVCLRDYIYNRLGKENVNALQKSQLKKTKENEQQSPSAENEQKKQEPQALTTFETEPRYKCNLCPAIFWHPSGIYRHKKKHELFELTGKMFRYRHSVNSTLSKPPGLSTTKTEESKDNLKPTGDVKTISLSCRFCGKCFSTLPSLKKHEHNHKGDKPYSCLECGKRFKRQSHLISHKTVHQRRIQCTVCKKILPTIKELIQHRSSHPKRGKLQCPDCNLQFDYPAHLLRHIGRRHKQENKAPELEETPQLKPQQSFKTVKDNDGLKPLKCSLCKEVFHNSRVLRKHCLTHITRSLLNQCPFCKKNCTSRKYLLRHMNKHTGDKGFSCPMCGKQFYREKNLILHRQKCSPAQTTHPATKDSGTKKQGSHQCSYCPRVFCKKMRLKNHLRGHKSNSLLRCSKCEKYYGITKLNTHQKDCFRTELDSGLSTNENLRKCTSQISQDVHKVAQQSSVKILKLKCPHCTKTFRFRSVLERHIVSHTGLQPYLCVHCGHRFKSWTKCVEHKAFCHGVKAEQSKVKDDAAEQLSNMPTVRETAKRREAHNESQYKCKFCTKTFMKPRSLRCHILTHNEVKPYRCKACDNCFSRYDHLKIHQIRCKERRSRLEVCIPKISLDDVGKGWQNRFSFEPTEKQETLECKICSRLFPTQSKLSRHDTLFHVAKLFKCSGCGSSFSHEKTLKYHRKRKKCRTRNTKAPKDTNSLIPMDTIMKTQNVKKTLNEVNKCSDWVTLPPDGRRNHVLLRIQPHFNKKYKYICSYCPRGFANTYQLRVHTRLHTGEKPYACDYCGQRFIRKDYVLRHYVNCTKKSQQKKVLCDKCGGFFSRRKLESHKRTCTSTTVQSKSTDDQGEQSTSKDMPKGFSCAYCSSRFLLFSQLQEHFLHAHKMETMCPPATTVPLQHHLLNLPNVKEELLDKSCDEQPSDGAKLICQVATGLEVSKPFSCSECYLSFVSKSGLITHMRMHTREQPFNCKTCKKGFWNKTTLRNHHRKCRYRSKSVSNSAQKIELPVKATPGTEVLQTSVDGKELFHSESSNLNETNKVEDGPSKDKKVVQYQCSECDKSFTDGLMLISHLEDHGREEQDKKHNTCTKCGRVFSSQAYLEKHMKMHGIDKKYSCPDCPKMFYTSSDLDIHITCHDQSRPYACKLCDQRFWTRPYLSNHYNEEHPDNVFSCRFCNKSYSVKKSLVRHYKSWHQQEQKDNGTAPEKKSAEKQSGSQVSTTGESYEDDDETEDSDSDSAPYFPCHVCGKTFPTSESLEDHQRCHLGEKPHECAECGRCFFQASQLQQHQRMHKSEFQCQACGRGFVTLFALRNHKHTHGKNRPHRCSKCGFSFTGPSQLAEHMSTHREENFPCDICNRVFSSKSSRAEHRKSHSKSGDRQLQSVSGEEHDKSLSVTEGTSVFPKELKYRCGVCSERFEDPEILSEHGCMAAKERPYSCLDCDKHFLHKSHLKKHRSTHHLSCGRSEYPCNQCNNSFSSCQQFLSHLRNHEDTAKEIKCKTEDEDLSNCFICPLCHQSCDTAAELVSHFDTHTDGSFECKTCEKTFPSGSMLKEHERKHVTSATQFECTECSQSFLGRDAFRQHRCFQPVKTEGEHLNPSVETSQNRKVPGEEEEDVDVTGEDLYYCPICSMQFSSKSVLLEHQNIQHQIKRSFKCELCGKTFALRRYLKEHERRHRQKLAAQTSLAENKLKCTKCHNEFNTTQEMTLHLRLHAENEVGEFRCDMCYKSFGQWSLLKQHQESHVGQVVYECNECDKAFAFPHLLEEHQQTHAGSSQ